MQSDWQPGWAGAELVSKRRRLRQLRELLAKTESHHLEQMVPTAMVISRAQMAEVHCQEIHSFLIRARPLGFH